MRIKSLPESPQAIHGLQFSFLPPGAALANVSEANSPNLARENEVVFGGRRVSTRNTPILKMKKLRLREVKKFP